MVRSRWNEHEAATRNWVEARIEESEVEMNQQIGALHRRIAALERVIQVSLHISQEEMDALLGKP